MKRIKISKEQREFFSENGYLVIEKVLAEDDLQDVINELNTEIDIRAKQLFNKIGRAHV